MSEKPTTTRRGRTCKRPKIKMENMEVYNDDEMEDPDFLRDGSEEEEVTPVRKRRGKKPKKNLDLSNASNINESSHMDDSKIVNEEEDSTDQDEEGEEDIIEEFEEDQENALVTNEKIEILPINNKDDGKDVYDFDCHSQISHTPVDNAIVQAAKRKSCPKTYIGKGFKGKQQNRVGSIYGGLASTLVTQSDFDVYSKFLDSPLINGPLDNSIAILCRPCNAVSNLYYGPSAALQSLLSRNPDQEKIISAIKDALGWDLDNKAYRISTLFPVINQPTFSIKQSYSITNSLKKLSNSIKYDMEIHPIYLLDQRYNCFTNDRKGTVYYRPSQYAAINDAANLTKQYGLVDRLLVPTEVFENLFYSIRPSNEEIIDYCASDEPLKSDINPFTRIIAVTDKELRLLAFAEIEVCDAEEIPISRKRVNLNLHENKSDSKNKPKQTPAMTTTEEDFKDLMSDVVDWVSTNINEKDYSASMKYASSRNFNNKELLILDASQTSFNGKTKSVFLSLHTHTASSFISGINPLNEPVYNYCLTSEDAFTLSHYTITPDVPIPSENRHLVDPKVIDGELSIALIPDIIYEKLRILVSSELISTSSPIINNALSTRDQTDIMQKFIILDSRTNLPISVAVDLPMKISLQLEEETSKMVFNTNAEAHNFLENFAQERMSEVEKNFKATHTDCKTIVMNGLVYVMVTEDKYKIIKLIRILPISSGSLYPNLTESIYCGQSLSGNVESSIQFMKVYNEETQLSTFLPTVYYSNVINDNLCQSITGFSDRIIDVLSNLPIKISVYEMAFRIAQKFTLKILAKQHIQTDPNLPIPEIWNICNFCLKELKGSFGVFDHEVKHLQHLRFRCEKHCILFYRRGDFKEHLDIYHNPNTTMITSQDGPFSQFSMIPGNQLEFTQEDCDSDNETAEQNNGFKKPKDQLKPNIFSSLAHVFSTNLVFKCEPIQCEKCKDYFPRGDSMATHIETCDCVSFSIRTPLPKNLSSTSNEVTIKQEDESNVEIPADSMICGICGSYFQSLLDLGRHFSETHFKCILCEATQRSVEELSVHYSRHIEMNDINSMNESSNFSLDESSRADYLQRMKNVIACNMCNNFHGTLHNFYYHQWTVHSVVHPPISGEQLNNLTFLLASQNENQNSTLVNTSMVNGQPQKRASKIVVLTCKYCEVQVRAAGNEYADHLCSVHNLEIDSCCCCRICAEITNSPKELSDHIAEHHMLSGAYANAGIQTVFSCTSCVFYGFHNGIVQHCKNVHNETNPAIYQCLYCHERFNVRSAWKRHIDTHSENYNFQCQECGRTFRLRNSLITHIKNHHPEDPELPSTCEYCGLVFIRASLLQHHINTMHNAQMPYECLQCHRRFSHEGKLRRHQKEFHSGIVHCEICNKMCENIKSYAVHRRKHFKVRVYQCNDCNASFKSKGAMKRHIRVEHLHLGPEKYECQICGKVVTQIGMHMLTHKGSRYECEFCGKGFTKSAYYNEHLRIHKGELPFECKICQRKFNKKSNLNVHLKFHEKHRDADGNYLELKHRNRISVMFGDANLTPEQRQARNSATRLVAPPTESISCGPDNPGAFNVGGEAWSCAKACETVTSIPINKTDSNETMKINGTTISSHKITMDQQFDDLLKTMKN